MCSDLRNAQYCIRVSVFLCADVFICVVYFKSFVCVWGVSLQNDHQTLSRNSRHVKNSCWQFQDEFTQKWRLSRDQQEQNSLLHKNVMCWKLVSWRKRVWSEQRQAMGVKWLKWTCHRFTTVINKKTKGPWCFGENSLCSCVSVRSRTFVFGVKLCSCLFSFSTSSKGLSHEYLCLLRQKQCIWNVTQPVDDGSYNIFFLFIVVNHNIFKQKK